MPSIENSALAFSRDIQARALPIEAEDAYGFAKAILDRKPPEGWLAKVAAGCQFIDRSTFERDLQRMAQVTSSLLNPLGGYEAHFSGPSKSDAWIYNQLLELGLEPAATGGEIIDKELLLEQERVKAILREKQGRFNEGEYDNLVKKREELIAKHYRSLPPDHLICAFDDFAISGLQFSELLYGDKGEGEKQNRLHAFLLYSTPIALRKFNRDKYVVHQSGAMIAPIQSALDRRDIRFLNQVMHEVDGEQAEVSNSTVLFWSWHKIPDNVPAVFTGKNFPPLIRRENFHPPYRQEVEK